MTVMKRVFVNAMSGGQTWRVARLLSLGLMLAGCGGGAPGDLPDLIPVTGTVTQGGKPLAGALVYFEPAKGAPSTGLTDDAGRFELQYSADHSGAVAGMHTVRISKPDGDAGPETIAAKFNAESQITREVQPGESNDILVEI